MKRTIVVAVLVGMSLSMGIVGCSLPEVPSEPVVFSVLYNEREANLS